MRRIASTLAACLLFALRTIWADPAPFDLAGPKLKVEITRGAKTLPISAVPNLEPDDELSIQAEFPKGQTAHYLLVAAFLHGATNPPPENWFYSSETWNPKQSAGLHIKVPQEAQQLVLFLAPEAGGDMHTLIGAVRGRPGAFVRASQDLNQATLDRARLKAYLAAVRALAASSEDKLKAASPLLARSLGIKLNADCLDKIPELQAPCLMQGQDALILNDGHSTSIAASLTSGNAASLIGDLSVTPQAGMGYYSPYVASVMDMARILDSFHTAQYQYIPALNTEQGDEIALELNAPPSFHNPKSVLVVALPAIGNPQMPPMRPVDPKSVYCAEKSDLVLPVEGAPLVFAMGYAHDMVIRLKRKDGQTVDLPLKADAEKGGMVANTASVKPADFGDSLAGSLHGYWGFEPYDGPEFKLENVRPQHWNLDEDDQNQLVAGQNATLHLETDDAACVDNLQIETQGGQTLKADWKSVAPNRIEVAAPLKKIKAGTFKILIHQYGSKDPDAVSLRAFEPSGRLDAFQFHAGDKTGVLKGTRLQDVKEIDLKSAIFRPTTGPADEDERSFALADAKGAAALTAGEPVDAVVELQDGRKLHLETTVAAPRPAVDLLAKSVQAPPSTDPIRVLLTDDSEVPAGATLTFSIHARIPASFSGSEKVELTAGQGAAAVTLTANNGLTLEDAQILLATVDTAKSLPASAAGTLRFRIVRDGIAGDWQPLAKLVRLPSLHKLACDSSTSPTCTLSGTGLFLIDTIATDAQFSSAVQVPAGFPGFTLSVPHADSGKLYVKLHDAPAIVNEVQLPATAQPPAAPEAQPKDAAATTSGGASGTKAPDGTKAPGGAAQEKPDTMPKPETAPKTNSPKPPQQQ